MASTHVCMTCWQIARIGTPIPHAEGCSAKTKRIELHSASTQEGTK